MSATDSSLLICAVEFMIANDLVALACVRISSLSLSLKPLT
jgi:hypothetical protein